ncbi:MAG: FAD-dependent oxidoreductase, partial [Acidimicrobiia bacterium]
MTEHTTVLVLGGGVGGAVAARSLRKKLPKQHRIVVVDRERDHLFSPSLLWLMTGKRTPGSISRPLDRLARRGIEVIHGEISSIEVDTRCVHVVEPPRGSDPLSPRLGGVDRAFETDYLIVSLGVDLAPE